MFKLVYLSEFYGAQMLLKKFFINAWKLHYVEEVSMERDDSTSICNSVNLLLYSWAFPWCYIVELVVLEGPQNTYLSRKTSWEKDKLWNWVYSSNIRFHKELIHLSCHYKQNRKYFLRHFSVCPRLCYMMPNCQLQRKHGLY